MTTLSSSQFSRHIPQDTTQLSGPSNNPSMQSPLSSEERQLLSVSLFKAIIGNSGASIRTYARHLLGVLLGTDTWTFCCEEFGLILDSWDALGDKQKGALISITAKLILSDVVSPVIAEKVLLKLVRQVACFSSRILVTKPLELQQVECAEEDKNIVNTWILLKEYIDKQFSKKEIEASQCSQILLYISLKTVYVAAKRAEISTQNCMDILLCTENIIHKFRSADFGRLGFCFCQLLELILGTIPSNSLHPVLKRLKNCIEHIWNRVCEFSMTLSPSSVILGSLPANTEKQLQQISLNSSNCVEELEKMLVPKEEVHILDLIRYFMHCSDLNHISSGQTKNVLIGLVQLSMQNLGIDPTSKTLFEPLLVARIPCDIQDSSAVASRASVYKILHVLFNERVEMLNAILLNLRKICEENAAYAYRVRECFHFDTQSDTRVKEIFSCLFRNFKIGSLCKQLGAAGELESFIIDLTESDDEEEKQNRNLVANISSPNNAVELPPPKRKRPVIFQGKKVVVKKPKVVDSEVSAPVRVSPVAPFETEKVSEKQNGTVAQTDTMPKSTISDQKMASLENGIVVSERGQQSVSAERTDVNEIASTPETVEKDGSVNFTGSESNIEKEQQQNEQRVANESVPTPERTENSTSVDDVNLKSLENHAEQAKQQQPNERMETSEIAAAPETVTNVNFTAFENNAEKEREQQNETVAEARETESEMETPNLMEIHEEAVQSRLNVEEDVFVPPVVERSTSGDDAVKYLLQQIKLYLTGSETEAAASLEKILKNYTKNDSLFSLVQGELAELIFESLEHSATVLKLKKVAELLYKELVRKGAHRVSSLMCPSAEFLCIVRQHYSNEFQKSFTVSQDSVMVNLISQGRSGLAKIENAYQLFFTDENEMAAATSSTRDNFNRDLKMLVSFYVREDAMGFLLDIASLFPDFIVGNVEYFDLLTREMDKDNMKKALELVQNGTIQMLSPAFKVRDMFEFLKASFEWKSHEKQTFLWKLLLKDISNHSHMEQVLLCHEFLLQVRSELAVFSLSASRAVFNVFSDWIILQTPNMGILFTLFELGEPFKDKVSDILSSWLVKPGKREELIQLLTNCVCPKLVDMRSNDKLTQRFKAVLLSCCQRLPFFQFLKTEQGRPLMALYQRLFQADEEITG